MSVTPYQAFFPAYTNWYSIPCIEMILAQNTIPTLICAGKLANRGSACLQNMLDMVWAVDLVHIKEMIAWNSDSS